jgi:hypothetical protein
LGACWQDQSIDLKGMDVVYCNGELEPRIVIKQENGLVTMVKTANSSDPDNEVSSWRFGAAPGKATPWNIDDSGDLSSEGRATAV